MATKREKNSGKQQKRELWKKILFWTIGIGFQVFLFLAYFTYLPVNKLIDPDDTVTVTVIVQHTEFGEGYHSSGRRGGGYNFFYLNIYSNSEKFRITGKRNHDWYAAKGTYSVPELNEAIQAGDTLTVTYRQFYPWLMPRKYVVGICEGEQTYRSLDKFNENVAGALVQSTVLFIVFVLITLPITAFFLDIPGMIRRKIKKRRK